MYVTNLYNHRFFHHTLVMWPAAVSPFRTGKHPLVYQPPPCCRFVQENTLGGTDLRLAAVSYRKTPSGVPTSALLPFRTGKHPLVYQPPPCCRFVQENTLWCTDLRLAAVSYRKVTLGVPTGSGDGGGAVILCEKMSIFVGTRGELRYETEQEIFLWGAG